MTFFLKIYTFFFLALFSSAFSQERITIIPFEGWKPSKFARYNSINGSDILTSKIAVRLIKTNRFKVIDRKNIDAILKEQKLQYSGFIDEKTSVNIGGLIGVNKIINGAFTGNSVEYVEATYNKQGKKTIDAYYKANITASIKMLDVETAMYTEAVEAKGSGTGSNSENAINKAIDDLADNIINKFEKYFKIEAYLTKVDKSNVTVDKGKNFGIRVGMYFEVFETNLEKGNSSRNFTAKNIGRLRINFVGDNYALGRVFSGQNNIQIGNLIRESKYAFYTEAKILEKKKNKVLINAGNDLGLSAGSTFDVIKTNEIKDPSSGELYGVETKRIGKIYLTEIGPNFARGKIIKGRRLVENGMIIKETKFLEPVYGLSFSGGPLVIESKVNETAGTFEVKNRYTGTHEIEIDYSENEEIVNGMQFNLSGYMRRVENNYFVGGGFNLLNIEERLKGWAIDGFVNKQLGLLPEIIFISPGIGFGYGFLNQKLPGNIVNEISAGYSDNLHSHAFYYSININASVYVDKFNIFGGASFQSLSFTKWYYSVKIGRKEEGTESFSIPIELVPFSEILAPLSFKIGIKYEF